MPPVAINGVMSKLTSALYWNSQFLAFSSIIIGPLIATCMSKR